MDQTLARDADRPMPPMTRDAEPVAPDPAIIDPPEHNVVFTSLVTSDKDIVGLVAYSIYKQNKYDWLSAFSRLQGRMPDAAEAQSYLYGESTPRRLATYRHLAVAVLDGRGPDVDDPLADATRDTETTPAPGRTSPTPPPSAPTSVTMLPHGGARRRTVPKFQLSSQVIVGLCITLGVLLVLLWLLHSGAPMPPATPPR